MRNETPIGNRIRYIRKNRKATQKELAQAIGTAAGHVCHWEGSGWEPTLPSVPYLRKLAIALNVPADYLLGLSNMPVPSWDLNIEFGERLGHARLMLGDGRVTQREVATGNGFSRASLCKWENGKTYPSLENLVTLAREYNVSVDWLLGLKGSNTDYMGRSRDPRWPPDPEPIGLHRVGQAEPDPPAEEKPEPPSMSYEDERDRMFERMAQQREERNG